MSHSPAASLSPVIAPGPCRPAAFFQNISASFNEAASSPGDHQRSWDAQGVIPWLDPSCRTTGTVPSVPMSPPSR